MYVCIARSLVVRCDDHITSLRVRERERVHNTSTEENGLKGLNDFYMVLNNNDCNLYVTIFVSVIFFTLHKSEKTKSCPTKKRPQKFCLSNNYSSQNCPNQNLKNKLIVSIFGIMTGILHRPTPRPPSPSDYPNGTRRAPVELSTPAYSRELVVTKKNWRTQRSERRTYCIQVSYFLDPKA